MTVVLERKGKIANIQITHDPSKPVNQQYILTLDVFKPQNWLGVQIYYNESKLTNQQHLFDTRKKRKHSTVLNLDYPLAEAKSKLNFCWIFNVVSRELLSQFLNATMYRACTSGFSVKVLHTSPKHSDQVVTACGYRDGHTSIWSGVKETLYAISRTTQMKLCYNSRISLHSDMDYIRISDSIDMLRITELTDPTTMVPVTRNGNPVLGEITKDSKHYWAKRHQVKSQRLCLEVDNDSLTSFNLTATGENKATYKFKVDTKLFKQLYLRNMSNGTISGKFSFETRLQGTRARGKWLVLPVLEDLLSLDYELFEDDEEEEEAVAAC